MHPMIQRFFTALALIFMGSAFLVASTAHATIYTIEPTHTRVIYFVNHMDYSHFLGHFNKVSGTIDFNPSKPELSIVNVTIDATSVSMDNDALNQKLQGPDFFNTAKFPTIEFKSTTIQKTGTDTGLVSGALTMLGITKPVTLKVKFNHKGYNYATKAPSVGFSATAKINRSEFGMKNLLPAIGDKIMLRIEVEANQKN